MSGINQVINQSINRVFKRHRLNNRSKRIFLIILIVLLVWLIHSIYHSITQSLNQSSLAWMDDREATVLLRHVYELSNQRKSDGVPSINRSIGQTSNQSISQPVLGLRMLEFGSGKSSFALSRHTAFYVSIEHDEQWCNQLIEQSKLVQDQHITVAVYQSNNQTFNQVYDNQYPSEAHRLHFLCVAPNHPRDEQSTSRMLRWQCRFFRCPSRVNQFFDYLRMPQFLYSHYGWIWDIVFVDGRARPQAAYYSIPYLAKQPVASANQSVVIMHDWNNRAPYHIIEKWFDIIDAQYDSYQPGGGGLVVGQLKPGITGVNPLELSDVPQWWY